MKSALTSTTDYGVVMVRQNGHMYEVLAGNPNQSPRIIAAGTLKRPPQAVVVNDLRLDQDTGRVEVAGSEIHLTPTEFQILAKLMSEPTRIFSASELPACAVRTHVYRLRHKLPAGYIRNVPGRGWGLL